MGIIIKSLRGWRNCMRYLNRKVRFLGFFVHFLTTVALAFGVFTLASIFLLNVTTIDGESMEPTLQTEDRVLILKFGRFFNDILATEHIPKRGEIIVFNKDGNDNDMLIKRVVGLPKERVVIRNGVLMIYNEEHPKGFKPNLGDRTEAVSFSEEERVDVLVKRGELFVLGDNIAASADSRTLGNISLEDIDGNLILRTWPFSKFEFF